MTKLSASVLVLPLLVACSGAPDPAEDAASSDLTGSSAATQTVREALFAVDHDVWFKCTSGSGNHAVTLWITADGGSSTNYAFARYSKAAYEGSYVDSIVSLGKATLTKTPGLTYVFTVPIGKASATLDTDKGTLAIGTQSLATKCESFDAPYTLD